MSDATFTFRVDDELKSEFSAAAKQHDQTAAQLMRAFMRDYVTHAREEKEHDSWFRQQVRSGQESAVSDELIPNEDIEKRFVARREALKVRLGDEAS